MNGPITAEEYERRSRVWFREGRTYDQLPRRPRDRWSVLHALAQSLPADRALSEREVNEAIRAWLEGPGRSLLVDHVALRRELVDAWFIERDAAGQEYRRSSRYRLRQDFADGIEVPNP